jgi:TRAP transporter 4TM/12TM fusion protein
VTFTATIASLVVLAGVVYWGIGWIKDLTGDAAIWIVIALLLLAYLGLLRYAANHPELATIPAIDELPPAGPTIKVGLYFLLPVVLLVWCLTVERFSPGLSAFWATVAMSLVVITQRPLLALFRGRDPSNTVMAGMRDLFDGLVAGARNMIGIGVATAAAGIVVGTVTLTGIGLVMTEFVELISAGNLLLMLIFTAIISLILGMGLPTTANYIVVSTLMAPVVVELGAQQGLIVPLIAVHMFVFYFGILADDTPPVGLAAFAAAAIAKSDPIRTGIQGFTYDIRTAILPFMFIFNTQLLMIGIDHWLEFIVTVVGAVIAILAFAAATQGFFLVRSRIWETAALLLVAFTLFRPGYWWDMVYPPIEMVAATNLVQQVETMPPGSDIRLYVEGETLEGDEVAKSVVLPLGDVGSGEDRLLAAGIATRTEDGAVLIDDVMFGSAAESIGLDFDWEIKGLLVDTNRPPKEMMFVPGLILLGLIVLVQRRRGRMTDRA